MAHGDITHIEIPVSDLKRATAFYTELFGWDIAEAPGYEGYPMWRAPNQVSGGALTAREEGFTQPRSMVEVDSIDDTLAKAVDQGAVVVVEKTAIDETSWWALLRDPDGNGWVLQEINVRLPGRVDEASYSGADDLAEALRRAAAAHGEHEKRTGQADPDWPDWYATYMVREQTGEELPQ